MKSGPQLLDVDSRSGHEASATGLWNELLDRIADMNAVQDDRRQCDGRPFETVFVHHLAVAVEAPLVAVFNKPDGGLPCDLCQHGAAGNRRTGFYLIEPQFCTIPTQSMRSVLYVSGSGISRLGIRHPRLDVAFARRLAQVVNSA